MNEQGETSRPTTSNGSTTATDYTKGREALRLAGVANRVSEIARQNEHNENLRQAVNAEHVPGVNPNGADPMNLNIDSPQYHFYEAGGKEPGGKEPAATPPAATNIRRSNKTKNAKKRLGTLAKLAIGAGLLGTGVSIPLGISAIVSALNPDEKVERPATPAENKPTTERKYLLELGD